MSINRVLHPKDTGEDVRELQAATNRRLEARDQDDYLITEDGDLGEKTVRAVSRAAYLLGIEGPRFLQTKWENGGTIDLRTQEVIRYPGTRTPEMLSRADYRLKDAEAAAAQVHVAAPLATVLAASWGYHPGVHDGVDLICPPDAVIHSMTDGKVVRADSSGWWGLGNPGGATGAKGDGIIIVRCTEDVGPFRKGMNVCYGHAEKAKFRAGQTVKAGQSIGHAGFASAWHVHLMINDNPDTRGVGDRDPEPFFRYAVKNG